MPSDPGLLLFFILFNAISHSYIVSFPSHETFSPSVNKDNSMLTMSCKSHPALFLCYSIHTYKYFLKCVTCSLKISPEP